jgi:hypothetical protein
MTHCGTDYKTLGTLIYGEGPQSIPVYSESNNRYRNLEFSWQNWKYLGRVCGQY